MKVLVSDNISPKGVDILKKAGLEVDVKTGMKPEERWWLFTVTAAATGEAEDNGIGWRKALRYTLTENPVKDALPRARFRRPAQRELIPRPLPLFDR